MEEGTRIKVINPTLSESRQFKLMGSAKGSEHRKFKDSIGSAQKLIKLSARSKLLFHYLNYRRN